jgi:putative hemolysin
MLASYPIQPELIPPMDMKSGPYRADFARTEEELAEVLRLRFNIFNLELGEGLDASYESQMDRDKYDDQCHHLIVRDVRTNELIGTYRMQTHSMARQGAGFYSDDEYDLSRFPEELLDQALELGRACIAAPHRNGRVLFLLWRGLFAYLRHNNLRYMFGCCSLTSQSPEEGWALFTRLRRAQSLHETILIESRPNYQCPHVDVSEEEIAGTELPRLMSLYIDYGASICSVPALDRAFKTIDYLALFDLQVMPPKMIKIFNQDAS